MKKILAAVILSFATLCAAQNPMFFQSAYTTVTPSAMRPTFSPGAGSYSGAQTVTISSTAGTIECWNTTGSPATNGSTGCTTGTLINTNSGTACVASHTVCGDITVSVTETVYAAVGGTGYLDATGSAAYTITAAGPPTFVQANVSACNVGNGYSNTCTLSGVGSGHALVSFVANGGGNTPTVQDNGTNMTCKTGAYGAGLLTVCSISGVASGTHNVVANWSGGNGGSSQMVVLEYTAGTLDQTPPNMVSGTFSTTPNCPQYTTVSNNVTVITGWATTDIGGFPTDPPGFTHRAEFIDSPNIFTIASADNAPTGTVTGGTAVTPQWGNTNNYWGCLVTGIHP